MHEPETKCWCTEFTVFGWRVKAGVTYWRHSYAWNPDRLVIQPHIIVDLKRKSTWSRGKT